MLWLRLAPLQRWQECDLLHFCRILRGILHRIVIMRQAYGLAWQSIPIPSLREALASWQSIKKNIKVARFCGIAGISLRFCVFYKVDFLYGLLRALPSQRREEVSLRENTQGFSWQSIILESFKYFADFMVCFGELSPRKDGKIELLTLTLQKPRKG